MKKQILRGLIFALSFLSINLFAHGDDGEKKINVEKSTIKWEGKKVTGKHFGTIDFKFGSLTFTHGKITAGTFVVDMTSLNATDIEGEWQQKLNGHLKADDFFGVENHPTSTLVFKDIKEKSANVYSVNADLTIKGITKQVSFTLNYGNKKASTLVTVNRTKYGIKYGSGSFFDNLGDKTIDDDFTLEINLAL